MTIASSATHKFWMMLVEKASVDRSTQGGPNKQVWQAWFANRCPPRVASCYAPKAPLDAVCHGCPASIAGTEWTPGIFESVFTLHLAA